ncbi:MAG: lipid-A-disaccharide synthase [Paludibacteraceae bacterium]|nr:lipid-A-disaccharide synthase [Paludibacteraceae bacterium]
MAKYFLIAGEASGDLHAAALIRQLKQQDPEAHFVGLGGDHMAAAECHLYQDYRRMAFMGFTAVLRNLGQVRRNFKIAQQALLSEQPDALILIDYPSFNLKMASFCRKHLPKTKIFYYIAPKVWAWKKYRVHRIAKLCDEVLGIFPFEPAFYARFGYRCKYVGNPTVEEINLTAQRSYSETVLQQSGHTAKRSIALLPGSRRSEVSHCLPRMIEAARHFPDYHIVVTAAPGIEDDFYQPYLSANETLTRDTYGAVQSASAAIVNSGTATLETALLGCPQVAVYYISLERIVRYIRWMQPLFFSVPYFTLVNIIAGKQVIRECISNDFTVDKMTAELQRLLTDEDYKKEMLASYEHLRSLLGTQPAAATAATIITSKTRS